MLMSRAGRSVEAVFSPPAPVVRALSLTGAAGRKRAHGEGAGVQYAATFDGTYGPASPLAFFRRRKWIRHRIRTGSSPQSYALLAYRDAFGSCGRADPAASPAVVARGVGTQKNVGQASTAVYPRRPAQRYVPKSQNFDMSSVAPLMRARVAFGDGDACCGQVCTMSSM